MANLKFYRGLEAKVANAAVGSIWFNTADKTINVKTAEGWEKYAGNLKDASWNTEKSTLTINKYDGSKIDLDFSDMASATNVANVLGSFADAAKNDNTASIHARINKAFSDIQDLSDNKLNSDDQVVKSVDTTTNNVRLALDNNGKLSVTYDATGKVESNSPILVTGGVVYSAIEDKISGLDKADAAVANQYVSAVSEADGIVSVTRVDLPVHSVDTTADHGVNLSLSEGKIDVIVTPGSVAESNDSVVTGSAVYSAIQDEVTRLGSAAYTESSAYATADQGTKADNALQDVTGSTYVTVSAKSGNSQTISVNTKTVASDTAGLADAKDVKSYVDTAVGNVLGEENVEGMTVYGLDKRLDAVETLLAEDGDDVINNLKEVIDYFNGVKEEETGAALLQTVSTLNTDVAALQSKVDVEKVSTAITTAKEEVLGVITENEETVAAALTDLGGRVDALEAMGLGDVVEGFEARIAANEAAVATVDSRIATAKSGAEATAAADATAKADAAEAAAKGYAETKASEAQAAAEATAAAALAVEAAKVAENQAAIEQLKTDLTNSLLWEEFA